MSVVNLENFHEGLCSEFSIFSLPVTQASISETYFQEIRPTSQIANGVPLELHVSSGTNLDYLDLADTGVQTHTKLANKFRYT